MNDETVKPRIDRISFQLGMINCFAEMVACGVKKLAISPPVTPFDYKTIGPLSDEIVAGFGIKSYLEKSLMITDLQSEDFTRGKWSILYYRDDDVLQAYLTLKKWKNDLEEAGRLDREAARNISREFMLLLSYPEQNIDEIMSRNDPESPFMLAD